MTGTERPARRESLHDQADGEDGAREELDEARVGGVDAGGAAADDFREEASVGQHDACEDLRRGQERGARG